MSRRSIPLNGSWQIQPTNDDAVPLTWHHSCPVPALADCAAPRYDWRQWKYHWYRTTFEAAAQPELTCVVIEQAMFGTDVWLNGNHLGGNIACYTSQEYDARMAIRTGLNELVIRVGQRQNLPAHSAVGHDRERTEWIPGIWGDVFVIQCGNPRVKSVQAIPHIENATAEVRTTFSNYSNEPRTCSISSTIYEKRSSRHAGQPAVRTTMEIPAGGSSVYIFNHQIPGMRLWSPDDPFLYEIETTIHLIDKTADVVRTTFGMREFNIAGDTFLFNGKRVFLRGGNIAFHRFLSDADRGTLPWDEAWIKKVLIDIPKAHNFNFFRNHIGQMYNRWYDIADEHGMLLQNEWMFWTASGTKEQIGIEFTQWIQDNWNHPSIIIWDALNESSDDIVQSEIVPEMKQLDPTRPWEPVDFTEEHPYIYSLGPVLNDRRFGFTRSLQDIETSPTPTMLNEFCWWWLDKEFKPALLTKDVIERWLGAHWTTEQLIAHQSFLVQELVELFRRMRVDAIQPFVYISNNAGPTANWFVGDIKDAQPKPILAALKNAFVPFGISIELWDRHFSLNEHRNVRVFIFNDHTSPRNATIRFGIRNINGDWVSEHRSPVAVDASGCTILPVELTFPSAAAEYRVCAELYENDRENDRLIAHSEKIAFALEEVKPPAALKGKRFGVLGAAEELLKFLASSHLSVTSVDGAVFGEYDVLVAGEGALRSDAFQSHAREITDFVEAGKTLVLLEPEYLVEGKEIVSIAAGLHLEIEKREDRDQGGYDSYLFAENSAHPLWDGILPDHLKMFNGGYGGEIVSAHDVSSNVGSTVLARCGLKLKSAAVFEVPVGRGRIIVSRLQTRGRLSGSGPTGDLFARRVDPVLQKYLFNLLKYALNAKQ